MSAKDNKFTCRVMTASEGQLYRAVVIDMLWADAHDAEKRAEAESKDEGYWQNQVADPKEPKFVLFEGQKPVGTAVINFRDDLSPGACEFTGAYILKEYRGRGLGDLLMNARKEYLKAHEGPQKALAKIWAGNVNSPAGNRESRRVCERNGFTCTGRLVEGGEPYDVYTFHPK